MRLLNRLTIENLKQNRKRTLMTLIGIMLSVALITSISNLYVSAKESLVVYVKEKISEYHYGFQNMSAEDIEKLRQNRNVESVWVEDEGVYVRYTKEALRSDIHVEKADFVNEKLIELEKGFFFNNSEEMNTLVSSVLIVMSMIILTSIMCIKSSFDISISERIRQYGMLTSIGATKGQIRKNVYFEATILTVIGIPLGLVLGFLSSYLLIRTCDKLFEDILVFDILCSFSWIAVVVAVVLSLITIYFSAEKSARNASKITPIEAIRNQNTVKINKDDMYIPKWIHRFLGIGGELAYKNLQRNKQKYKTATTCLVICVSLFITVSSYVSGGFRSIELEYKDTVYNMEVEYSSISSEDENSVDLFNQYVEAVRRQESVDRVTYSGWNRLYLDEEESIDMSLIDEDSFKEYTEKLQLDYEVVKNQGILVSDSNLNISANKTILGYTQKWISSEIKEENKIINIPCELKMAVETDEVPYGHEEGKSCIILNVNFYPELIGRDRIERMYIYSADTEKTECELENLFDDLVEPEDTFWIINLEENEKEIRSFYTLVAIFLYCLIIVIAAIGITNMSNIISANVNLRKREFAVLKSIGMTSSEFDRMILLESIFYGRATLLIGIPIGLGLSYFLYGYTVIEQVPYCIPFKEMIFSTSVVLLLIVCIMKHALSKFNKENIIETMRKESI